jgi:phosphoglycerate-specific signal transduction histidine kinase
MHTRVNTVVTRQSLNQQVIEQLSHRETLSHPLQSPDLNSIEGVWNVLKERAKHRQWRTVAELKKVLLDCRASKEGKKGCAV